MRENYTACFSVGFSFLPVIFYPCVTELAYVGAEFFLVYFFLLHIENTCCNDVVAGKSLYELWSRMPCPLCPEFACHRLKYVFLMMALVIMIALVSHNHKTARVSLSMKQTRERHLLFLQGTRFLHPIFPFPPRYNTPRRHPSHS